MHRSRALAGALLALTLGGGGALAQEPPVDPTPGIPGLPEAFDDTATPVVPEPGALVDPAPIGWDHVTIWPDGRTVTVYFWSGPVACFGLDRVDVSDDGGAVSIAPVTGLRADAVDRACPAVLELHATDITLDAPVLAGGLPGVTGAQPPSGLETAPMLPGRELLAEAVQPWSRVSVGPDGTSLWVWFTGGPEPCFGLARVELAAVEDVPALRLITGAPTGSEVIDCVPVVLEYRTPVAIPDALVLGGQA